MGILKRIAGWLCAIFFILSLTASMLFYSLSEMTKNEERIKNAVYPIFKTFYLERAERENIEKAFEALKYYCSQNLTFPINISNVEINCSLANMELEEFEDYLLNLTLDSQINEIYNFEYQCGNLIECYNTYNFTFLLSSKANKLYKKYSSNFLIISLILGFFVFILPETISKKFLNLGGILLFFSLQFFLITIYLIPKLIPKDLKMAEGFVSLFYQYAKPKIQLLLIFSVFLIGVGIIFKFFEKRKIF